MRGEWDGATSNRILTLPNFISLGRLLMIPVFVWLLAGEGTEVWGFIVLGLVLASDWVDGYIARRTGQVSELGKLLDPLSDRLVIAAALVTFVVIDALPLWAAVLVIGRDVVVLTAGILALTRWSIRIDVRWTGKVATFDLMVGIPLIAWGGLNLPLRHAALACGWTIFALGLTLYYWTAGLYLRDMVDALRQQRAR
jgi:cardiolipin synthase (CMP-forming)